MDLSGLNPKRADIAITVEPLKSKLKICAYELKSMANWGPLAGSFSINGTNCGSGITR